MVVPKSMSVGVAADTKLVEDVDAAAAALSDGLQGEFVQTESSAFRGRWSIMRTPRLVVQFAFHEGAVFRRLIVPKDRVAFIVPLALAGPARWNGSAVQPNDLVVCPPGAECVAFDPPSTCFAIVTSRPTGRLVREARDFLRSEPAAAVTVRCGSAAAELHARLHDARRAIETGRVRLLSRDILDVATPLRACLERARSVERDLALSGTRNLIVRRAEEFFRTHVGEGVSVTQLSSVAGVSERSLRNAFYDVYTTSPKRYMKLWQLHQVRRALRSGDVRRATVTDVATCYGFYELGRFAGAYKSLFGEVPSQTLSKSRLRGQLQAAS